VVSNAWFREREGIVFHRERIQASILSFTQTDNNSREQEYIMELDDDALK
jgi:hypothetical protein